MVEQTYSSPAPKKAPRTLNSPLIPVLLGLLVTVAASAFAFETQSSVKASRSWVLHTYDVRSELQMLETEITTSRANALAYVNSGDQNQLLELRKHAAVTTQLIEELRKLTADNPRQQYRLGELESLSKKYLGELEGTVTTVAPHAIRPAEAQSTRVLDDQQAQQDALVRSMTDEEQRLLDVRLANWNRFFLRNAFVLTVAFVLALIFLVYNYALLNREITRSREMELVQRESVRSSRALSARILELQDSERRKVARELHDSVGQYLTGLKINVEQLLSTNPNLSPAHLKLLSDTVDLTDRSITEVRTISHLLHPPLLDEVGLESATRWYADGFAQRCGLRINLQLGEISTRLPKEVELALFRVLQEALTNVHRHANAKSIDIALSCRDGRVVLSIQDDGRGISREILVRFRSGLASGVGLAGMRERIAELDGVLEVEAKTRGTLVRATIPTLECAPERTAEEANTVGQNPQLSNL
jgi:signal transduction histidine kinase